MIIVKFIPRKIKVVIEVSFIKNPKNGGIPAREKKFKKIIKAKLFGRSGLKSCFTEVKGIEMIGRITEVEITE